MSKYLSFLEYLGNQEHMNPAQVKDIIMAKGSLHQAGASIAEAIRDEENREVVRDLLHRVEDWKGHKPDQFGDLILYDSLNVTKDKVTHPYRGYLFQNIFIFCKEVKPTSGSRTGFLFRKKKVVPTLQQTKFQLKGRIFFQNITDIVTGFEDGSYTCRVVWKTTNDTDSTDSFSINFAKESQMLLWSLKMNENRPSLTTKTDVGWI
jgi:cell division control protein 24